MKCRLPSTRPRPAAQGLAALALAPEGCAATAPQLLAVAALPAMGTIAEAIVHHGIQPGEGLCFGKDSRVRMATPHFTRAVNPPPSFRKNRP